MINLKKIFLFYIDIIKKFYLWLKIRVLTIKELKKPPQYNGYYLPPPKFRQLTTATHITVEEHIKEGFQASRLLTGILKKEGIDPYQMVGKVLDFGSGCGRVLRHIHKLIPNAQLFGCDIDENIIEWNRKNLCFAKWFINKYLPPTDFESSFFDIIYLISVFTHIDEKTQFAWLNEFSRIIKPKGLLIITVVPLGPNRSYNGMVYEYRKRDLVKRSWVRCKSKHPYYIDAKHSEHYCKTQWIEYFKIVKYYKKVLRGVQDLVLLRKE